MPTSESLRAKLQTLEETSPLSHRIRRSLSWLERAEAESDPDAKCIFLLVAFNAAYAIEFNAEIEEWGKIPDEGERRERYFEKLTRADALRLHNVATKELWDLIGHLMKNVYIFKGFWDSLTEERFDWRGWRGRRQFRQFESERDRVLIAYEAPEGQDTCRMLELIFNRLYVLRNQLMHGCATQSGDVNRPQVEDGAAILSVLMPLFLDIMMDHPEEDWGKISFPVRDDIREVPS